MTSWEDCKALDGSLEGFVLCRSHHLKEARRSAFLSTKPQKSYSIHDVDAVGTEGYML